MTWTSELQFSVNRSKQRVTITRRWHQRRFVLGVGAGFYIYEANSGMEEEIDFPNSFLDILEKIT